MARIKYYYDTETCKYERVKVTKSDVFVNGLGFLFISLILSIGIVFGYFNYFESPKEAMLRKENAELQYYFDILNKKVDESTQMLSSLSERDDNIYRTVFAAEPIPNSVRNAGSGGVEKYQKLMNEGLEQEELIKGTLKKIDKLNKQMYIQTKSYDEIISLAKRKDEMLASMPAIQPIENKKLKRMASGYGMRIHPIYKVRKMHTGNDFTARTGTPIYATGDGVVKVVETKYRGYGKKVIIDHGFGYQTLYAHMSKFSVKKGQKIKRGEIIGYVGNTGSSTAPHLHYEVIYKGKKVNPVHYYFNDLNSEEYDEILELASRENQSLS